ncbi:MAG: paeR7IM [Firmicutes bacterium]|nr:paeR7IM [Bacillota bacterium]
MNWKRFITECQEVKTWLQGQGVSQADLVLMKIIILVFSEPGNPEALCQKAVRASSLLPVIQGQDETSASSDIPDNIFTIIAKWQQIVPVDSLLLGKVYETLSDRRRAQGRFYTAPEIIDYILDSTIKEVDIVLNPGVRILDPACGSGNFLLKAYECLWDKFVVNRNLLITKFPDHDWSDDGIHRWIITQNLWGADIDAVAAEVAMASLRLKRPATSNAVNPNVVICDSLRLDQNYSRRFWSTTYDYVIGNPPYLSFGLRGTPRIDAEYAGYLRQAFPATAEYKLSYYVLFIERGINMLRLGGKLGFIIPDSFLVGRYYSKVRRYILENANIEKITSIVGPVFKSATIGQTVIAIFSKENNPIVRAQHKLTICQVQDSKDLAKVEASCSYRQNYFSTLPYNRFRLFTDLTIKNLIDKIDADTKTLGNFSKGHTGIRSVSKQSDIFALEPSGETWQRGLISGSQIERYSLTYAGHWLNIEPSALYKGGWDNGVVKQRKILVRQTGFSLTACIDEQGYYHLNNLHSFTLNAGSMVSLDYLLLLLNSRVLSFYYHAISMEYGRALAQTDIDTLELLPVRFDAKVNAQAVALVMVMQSLVARQKAGDNSVSPQILALKDFFNQLAYRVYDLSAAEIKHVEAYEAKLEATNQRRERKKK